MLDGVEGEASLLPFLMINFYFYMWHISLGFIDAIVDVITRRRVKWAKTKRFTESSNKEEESINKEKETIEI